MSEVVIKRADADNIEAIYELEKACFADPWPLQVLYEDICINHHLYYVILEDDVVVGYGGMRMILDEAHINNICVHPGRQGRGYGRKLMERLIRAAYKHGADSITLEVRASNEVALALYHSLGFEREGIRRRYYQNNGEDAIILWKQGLRLEMERALGGES